MATLKKTIFLSNKQDNNFKGMATLTLEKKNQNIFATIKTFNIDQKQNYILAIKQKEKLHKQNVILNNDKYSFIMSSKDNALENIGCVLFVDDSHNYTPLIWGSDNSTNYKGEIVSSLKENFEKLKKNNISKATNESYNVKNIDNKNDENIKSYNTNKWQSAHNIPTNNFSENFLHSAHSLNIEYENNIEEIATPPYHSEVACASSYATLFESEDSEIESTINNELEKETTNHQFYNMIAEQLNDLFNKYPEEQSLGKLIENSKWVKIKNNDNKYYVVGIIYDNNDIKYICYGVPGNYNKEPPIELREYSQWLPTDITNPFDNGYWVMYQDADTGENIIVN